MRRGAARPKPYDTVRYRTRPTVAPDPAGSPNRSISGLKFKSSSEVFFGCLFDAFGVAFGSLWKSFRVSCELFGILFDVFFGAAKKVLPRRFFEVSWVSRGLADVVLAHAR